MYNYSVPIFLSHQVEEPDKLIKLLDSMSYYPLVTLGHSLSPMICIHVLMISWPLGRQAVSLSGTLKQLICQSPRCLSTLSLAIVVCMSLLSRPVLFKQIIYLLMTSLYLRRRGFFSPWNLSHMAYRNVLIGKFGVSKLEFIVCRHC